MSADIENDYRRAGASTEASTQGPTRNDSIKLPVTTVITIEGPMFGPEVKVTITSKDGTVGSGDEHIFPNYIAALTGVEEFASSTADLLTLAVIKKLDSALLKR